MLLFAGLHNHIVASGMLILSVVPAGRGVGSFALIATSGTSGAKRMELIGLINDTIGRNTLRTMFVFQDNPSIKSGDLFPEILSSDSFCFTTKNNLLKHVSVLLILIVIGYKKPIHVTIIAHFKNYVNPFDILYIKIFLHYLRQFYLPILIHINKRQSTFSNIKSNLSYRLFYRNRINFRK